MTEQDWDACEDAEAMLRFLEGRRPLSGRKARLFAVAGCRLVLHLFPGERERQAVEVAEQFADGLVSQGRLEAARENFRDWSATSTYQCNAAWVTTHKDAWNAAVGAAAMASPLPRWHARLTGATDGSPPPLHLPLRDILGPLPFRTPRLDPAWLTPTVLPLAEVAYEERVARDPSRPGWLVLDPARLLVLADALEEAGCDERGILEHLRGPGEHVHGCFAVDYILGKE